MAIDGKETVNRGGEPKGPVSLDPDLVNAYLELQVQWLKLQVASAEMQATASERDAMMAATTSRLWRKAAPTAVIVAIVAIAATLLAALTWDDLWRGMTYGSTPGLKISANQKEGLLQGVGALSGFLKDWKDVLFGILGGGALIAFKRLAYRSLGSALVIALAVVLSASLMVALVIADLNYVDVGVTPERVALRGWGVVALAVVVGLVLMVELGDFAVAAGPAAFASRSQWYHGLGQRIAWFSTSTWPGRFLAWLVTPQGWRHGCAAVAVLMAISLVLSGAAVVASYVSTSNSVFWEAVFFVGIPFGPLWWLWLLGRLFRSPVGWRHPAEGPVRMAVFALVPVASLVAFVASFLAPDAYNPNTTAGTVTALIGVGAIIVWAFWFIWAGVALPASLRIAYLPMVVAFLLVGFGQHETLAFMGLGAVISVGVPFSLWRTTRQPVDSSRPAAGDAVVNPIPLGAE